MKGGATTISTPVVSFTRRRSSLTYFTVSSTVLYIFQLPAIRGVRINAPEPAPAKAGHYENCVRLKPDTTLPTVRLKPDTTLPRRSG